MLPTRDLGQRHLAYNDRTSRKGNCANKLESDVGVAWLTWQRPSLVKGAFKYFLVGEHDLAFAVTDIFLQFPARAKQ